VRVLRCPFYVLHVTSHILISHFNVTGNALPSDIQFFISNGADQVLLKPVDIDSLEAALYRLGGSRDSGADGGVHVVRGTLI
jgi:hypothetical protein